MQFNNEGISLRYGSEDTPAPGPLVQAGTEIALTVEVQPADASNDVEVRYRVNEGPTETVAAKWLWNDPSGKSQYFMAHLPAFHPGDTVEYTPICRCAGRQAPSPEEAQEFASSFRVVGEQAEPSPGVIPPRDQSQPSKTEAEHALGGTPITDEPKPLNAEAMRDIPLPFRVAGEEIKSVQDVATSIDEAESFKADKAVLTELLDTSPTAHTEQLRNTFVDLYTGYKGPIERFWDEVRQRPEFGEPSVVEDLQVTLQLGRLTRNNVSLVAALQELRREGGFDSPRDLTKLDAGAWRELITKVGSDGAPGIPPDVPGATEQEKVENYVGNIIEKLQEDFPTAFISQDFAKTPEIDLDLVKRVRQHNPHLDPAQPLPRDVDWSGIDDTEKAQAEASLETLRRESRMFPGIDPRNLEGFLRERRSVGENVSRFFTNVPDFDLRQNVHIVTHLAERAETAFEGIEEGDREAVATQLKRLQRVFRVAPKYKQLQALMGEGLDSASAITTVSEETFVRRFGDEVGSEPEARAIYSRAQSVSATVLNVYAHVTQALKDVAPMVIRPAANGTHTPQTSPDNGRMVVQPTVDNTSVLRTLPQSIKKMPTWVSLFDSLDLCDCEHCRSVYSPAAYFVDLMQFLNPKVWNRSEEKPLKVLLKRRPDLECIELTCENTNTTMPYVDLVNEVLESYVASGTVTAHDTENMTAAELSVNPQYTSDKAYTVLQEAVYPFSLPFHRPVEVARAYLEHLGSSRYQVMTTFQKPNDPATQLAINCEYLGLTAEEYKILTGAPVQNKTLLGFYGYSADILPTDKVWVEDELPTGATPGPEGWGEWVGLSNNPAPFSGTKAHYSRATGEYQHRFTGATDTLTIESGDKLFAYVYLDPGNLPSEIMLKWFVGTGKHRAYWGANLIPYGTDGTESRRRIGDLPKAGEWVRLEVSAALVGLEGKTIDGMAFSHYGGAVYWDRAGSNSVANGQTWQESLAQVPEFLRRTGIQYTDLVELLRTGFINPDRKAELAITLFSPDSACDLNKTRLQHLNGTALSKDDESVLQKVHRFIRLWRKLGWSMQDLDKTIAALKETDITGPLLEKLAHVKRLQTDLGLPPSQLSSLWANIDTQGDDALYPKLFQNRAVLNPVDRAFELSAVGDLGPFDSEEEPTISANATTIMARLRIDATDLDAIRADAELPDDRLSLTNLSKLYRYVVLSRALGLSIEDLIALKKLTGLDPFKESAPAPTAEFVEKVRKVRQSGFTVAQLNYLCRHLSEPTGGIAPPREQVVELIENLQNGLRKILEETAVEPDPTGELLQARLPAVMDPDQVNDAMKVFGFEAYSTVYAAPLNNLPQDFTFPDELARKVYHDESARQLRSGQVESMLDGVSGRLVGIVPDALSSGYHRRHIP